MVRKKKWQSTYQQQEVAVHLLEKGSGGPLVKRREVAVYLSVTGSDHLEQEVWSQKQVMVRTQEEPAGTESGGQKRKWRSTCQQQEVVVYLSATGSDRLEQEVWSQKGSDCQD